MATKKFTEFTQSLLCELGSDMFVGVKGGANVKYTTLKSITLPVCEAQYSGVIYKGASVFIHDYKATGSDGHNVFIGAGSGNYTMAISGQAYHASRNIGIGLNSLTSLTTGYYNVGIGAYTNNKCTTGAGNMAIGNRTLGLNTTGFDNVAMGDNALGNNTISSCNVGIGHYAGETLIASGVFGITTGCNTFLGYRADVLDDVIKNTIVNSTALGANATVTASNQIVIGNASVTEVYLGSTTGASKLICSKPKFTAIPTAADGLSAGDVWSNGGVLTIVS